MKKILLAVLFVLAVLTPITALSQVGTATVTAQGSFTLNGGDVLTLAAQVVGCSGNVPLYQGNPISLAPNQPAGSNGFAANGSQQVTLTLPGNDKIICGGQNYSLYALTWKVNNYPVAPTETYRFLDGNSYVLSQQTPVGFVPPILANGAGVQCPSGQALLGFTAQYQPICGASGSGGGSATLPNASSANQALLSTGPGTNYQAFSLPPVTLSGSYNDLTSKPTLGTAASHAATDFDGAGSATNMFNDSVNTIEQWVNLTFVPISGLNLSSQPITLNNDINGKDGTPYQTLNEMTSAIQAAVGGSSSGGGTTGNVLPTGIDTIVRQGSMSDGTIPFKTCYVGSSVCSGGVGTTAPASTPTKLAGLSTPNASTGTANAVSSYTLSTAHPSPTFTSALWTTTSSGLGLDTTSTNMYRDLWIKAAFAAGHTHIEFDTYLFDGSWDYMGGTQCNNTKNLIQIDNQGNGWVDTTIPCATLYDGNWHHIQQTFHLDRTNHVLWWDAMAIDNTLYGIGKSLPATSTTWQGSGGQIQLDMDPTTASSGNPATDTLYVDTDTVIMGTSSNSPGNPGGDGGSGTAGTGELGSFSWDGASPTSGLTQIGSPVISTSNYHSSPNSMSFPSGANNYFTYSLPSSTPVLYTRQYLYISSIGSNAQSILRFYHGGAELFVWYISTGGTLTAFDQATTSDISSGYTMPTGAIHRIETYTKISPTAGQVIVEVDGSVVFTSANNLNTGSSTIDTVWFGQFGNTIPAGWGTTYMDNVDFSGVTWIGSI